MSIQPLITILEQLLEAHETLLELSSEKTKVLSQQQCESILI